MKKNIILTITLAFLIIAGGEAPSQAKVSGSSIFGGFLSGVKFGREVRSMTRTKASKPQERKGYGSKPYILYLEMVTPQDVKRCQADDNCMDILPTSDLAERNDLFCSVEPFSGQKHEFKAPMTNDLQRRLAEGGGLFLGSCAEVITHKNTYCNKDGSGCHVEFDIMNPETEANQS